MKLFSFFAVLFFAGFSAMAQDFPKPAGFVTDAAGVLSPQQRAQLESRLRAVEQASGVEIAVVTVSSLQETPLEDYAVKLYETWGIGKKGKDEGVLLLLAPQEREVRIEVGYGLEGTINDALAGEIIREVMVPEFQQGRLGEGLLRGTGAILGVLSREYPIPEGGMALPSSGPRAPPRLEWTPGRVILAMLFGILFVYLFIRHPRALLFIMLMTMGGRRGGGGFGGGSFGGGFGGFGGGLSGGGGASGRW